LSLRKCAIVPPSLQTWIYAISVHEMCNVLGGVTCGIYRKRAFVGVVAVVAVTSICVGLLIIQSYSPKSEAIFLNLWLASTFGCTTFKKID